MISNQNSYPGVTTEKSLANEFFTKATLQNTKIVSSQGLDLSKIKEMRQKRIEG